MRMTHFAMALLLGSALVMSFGCSSGGDETDTVKELPPEKQQEIEKLHKAYESSGRYGPGGQNKPQPPQGGKAGATKEGN